MWQQFSRNIQGGAVQVHLKKKLNIIFSYDIHNIIIFCHSFQKVKPIYYIDSLHIELNMSCLYFFNFDDYG